MGNDSGALILLIVLIVSAFLLIVIKLAQFADHFSREKKYLLTEMNRAADYNEYRYWRRELRCLYLCLIPFVNKRNVRKVYSFFFHRARHAKKEAKGDGIIHILAPSIIGVCLCAVCLCGMSWAWFTTSVGTGTQTITASSYVMSNTVLCNGIEQSGVSYKDGSTKYTFTSGTYTVTLNTVGTDNASGYCKVKIGDTVYYTDQISANGTFTFSIEADGTVGVVLIPSWGSCATRTEANRICSGATVQVEGTPVTAPAKEDTSANQNTTVKPSDPDLTVTTSPEPNTESAMTEPVNAESITTEPESTAQPENTENTTVYSDGDTGSEKVLETSIDTAVQQEQSISADN